MTREKLKELGYTDEQINELMDLNGKAIEKVKNERDAHALKITDLENEITKRDEDIKKLQDNPEGDNLKKKIESLQAEYQQFKDESKSKELEFKKESALGIAIAKSGTIDEVSFRANLNLDEIKLTDEGLEGFDTQLESLKENKSFLFGEALDQSLVHRQKVEQQPQLKDILYGGQKEGK